MNLTQTTIPLQFEIEPDQHVAKLRHKLLPVREQRKLLQSHGLRMPINPLPGQKSLAFDDEAEAIR